MKFFIDTANLNEIKEAYDLGVLDGVTTNPSLMAKEGIAGHEKVKAHYKAICNIVDNNVSAEVIATDFDGIIKEGYELAKIDDKIVVKVPMIKDGIKAIKKFTSEGIRTNCTLVFSPGQAILAAKAGASYLSPFVGRLDDISQDGLDFIAQVRLIYDNYAFDTEILAASVRHSMHLIKCAEIGADVVTCPLNVITGLLNHPLTDSGLAKFLADHKIDDHDRSKHPKPDPQAIMLHKDTCDRCEDAPAKCPTEADASIHGFFIPKHGHGGAICQRTDRCHKKII